MRARFMGFFPRLNPLALVPLGLGPKNLAKHNFKSKVSQLAGLNFLEPRFSSKHANICKPQVKTNKKPWKTQKWRWVKHVLGNDGSWYSHELFMVNTNILIIFKLITLGRVALPTISNYPHIPFLLYVKLVCGFPIVNVDAPTVSTVFDVLFICFCAFKTPQHTRKLWSLWSLDHFDCAGPENMQQCSSPFFWHVRAKSATQTPSPNYRCYSKRKIWHFLYLQTAILRE